MRRSSSPAARVLTLLIVSLFFNAFVNAQGQSTNPLSLPGGPTPGPSTTRPSAEPSTIPEPSVISTPTTTIMTTTEQQSTPTTSPSTPSTTSSSDTSTAITPTSSRATTTSTEEDETSTIDAVTTTPSTPSQTTSTSTATTAPLTPTDTSETTTAPPSAVRATTTDKPGGSSYYTGRATAKTGVSTSTVGAAPTAGATSHNGFFANKGAVAGTFVAVALVSLFLIWVGATFVIRRQRRRARARRVYSGAYGATAAHRRRPGSDGNDLEAYKEKGYGVELAPSGLAGTSERPNSGLIPGVAPPAPTDLNEKVNGAAAGAANQDQGTDSAYSQHNYGQASYAQAQQHGQQAYERAYEQASGSRAHAGQHQVQPSQDYSDAYGGHYDGNTTQGAYDAHAVGQQQYDANAYGQHAYAVDYPPAGADYPRGTAYAAAARQQGHYQYTAGYGSDAALAQVHPYDGVQQQQQPTMSHPYNSPAAAYGTAR